MTSRRTGSTAQSGCTHTLCVGSLTISHQVTCYQTIYNTKYIDLARTVCAVLSLGNSSRSKVPRITGEKQNLLSDLVKTQNIDIRLDTFPMCMRVGEDYCKVRMYSAGVIVPEMSSYVEMSMLCRLGKLRTINHFLSIPTNA